VKHKRLVSAIVLVFLLVLLPAGSAIGQGEGPSASAVLGAGFTYQGELADGGGRPVSSSCDFRFGLWDAASGGTQVGAASTVLAVPVAQGLFTASVNAGGEFGANAFVGQARWLQVAVRCPAGSGSYAALAPRQPLTAAPAALSLALPYRAEASTSGPLISIQNNGGGDGASFGSKGGHALRALSAGQDGVRVDVAGAYGLFVGEANRDGLHVRAAEWSGISVVSAGRDGVSVHHAGSPSTSAPNDAYNGFEVAGAEGSGLSVGRADLDGAYVSSAGQRGFAVGAAGTEGVYVGAAGSDGVIVHRAGNPSAAWPSDGRNGFEVAGAKNNGLYIGRADGTGIFVYSAGGNGVWVNSATQDGIAIAEADRGVWVASADDDGIEVSSAGHDGVNVVGAVHDGVSIGSTGHHGLYVYSAGSNGIQIDQAAAEGVRVVEAGEDGVQVDFAGNPSSWTYNSARNGVEVNGAEGYGLYVGRADLDGVYVNSTAWHGVSVANAGVDGLYVASAGDDGVDVAGKRYAGNFRGNINVTGDCVGCTIAVFGLNAGDRALEPGQIVAIQGVQASTLENASALWRVLPAGEGSPAIGVVRGRAEPDVVQTDAQLGEGETTQRLVPSEGAAEPGQYVTIVIYGPVQVQTSAMDGSIQPGTRLAAGDGGTARALKTVVVEGVTLAESAPTVGIALGTPDKAGLVWLLVNPQ
jgi:hypothetical protein